MSNQFSTPEESSRGAGSAGLGVTLALLLVSLGCQASSVIQITGNFSNSSLKGNYQYQLFGIDTTGNYYAEAGVFVADGNGNITSGREDFNQNGSFASNSFTGNYTISRDGNGFLTFNLSNSARSFALTVTLISTSQLYLTEADLFTNASGTASLQDTTKFASAPSGTFVVRVHTVSNPTLVGGIGSVATVGALTCNSPTVTGSLDVLLNSALSQVALTAGNISAPDATGRGTLSTTYVINGVNYTSNYFYYLIDGNTLALLESDGNFLALGRGEAQGAAPFSISGSYAFGSSGDTSTGVGFARTVGEFSASAATVSGGTFDSALNQVSILNQSIASGQVTGPDLNGRATVSLTAQGGNQINAVYWMVNSSRAFFVVNDPARVEDGTADLQSSSSFDDTSLKGQYALLNRGFTTLTNPNSFLTRVGTLIPDGAGNLSLNEWENLFTGSASTSVSRQVQIAGGNYTVGSNGRVAATLPSLSNNLILYLVSPSQGYVLQNDTGVEISGQIALQASP